MKKVIVAMLAAAFVLVFAGTAFAYHGGNSAVIGQSVIIANTSTAVSGSATAIGNVSSTNINSKSKAKSFDGNANNHSNTKVTNSGSAHASSGNAKSINRSNNWIKQHVDIKQKIKNRISIDLDD